MNILGAVKIWRNGFAAQPPDVRYGSALPKSFAFLPGLCPDGWGVAPQVRGTPAGRSQTFRTSGGTAAKPSSQNFLVAKPSLQKLQKETWLTLLMLALLLIASSSFAQSRSALLPARMRQLLHLPTDKAPLAPEVLQKRVDGDVELEDVRFRADRDLWVPAIVAKPAGAFSRRTNEQT